MVTDGLDRIPHSFLTSLSQLTPMSLHVDNATDIQPEAIEDSGSRLTPGQIALITILTSFVFYMTIMFIVCIGETCQYRKGRLRKLKSRKTRQQAGKSKSNPERGSGNANSSEPASGADTSSPYVQLSSDNCSASSTYTKTFERAQNADLLDHKRIPVSKETVEVHNEETTQKYYDSEKNMYSVNLNCDTVCDGVEDTGAMPLISRFSDDTIDTENLEGSEIYCDSDSRDMTLYRLEADV